VADIIKNFELTLANTEAQRKKDLDMAGTQIAALKKDSGTQIAALKKDSETQIAALKKDLGKAEAERNDLKDKIELLNREAATTKYKERDRCPQGERRSNRAIH
jgi:chromosome segregation ATPase